MVCLVGVAVVDEVVCADPAGVADDLLLPPPALFGPISDAVLGGGGGRGLLGGGCGGS